MKIERKKLKSYDILGSKEKSIAIIDQTEDPQELAKKIMVEHKNVKTVLMKMSERIGIERKRKYKLLTGEKNTEIIHNESGCRFKLDPRKVYFSGREGTERLRIASLVKPKETVLVMFAGVGPFPIMIAKKKRDVEIIPSIEVNKKAVEYMKQNVKLNKVEQKVIPILGDVKDKAKDWFGRCDRILMPLPHESSRYINLAVECLKKEGGMIHLYLIESENEIEKKAQKLIDELKDKMKFQISYKIKKVLPYSPRKYKYCLDISLVQSPKSPMIQSIE